MSQSILHKAADCFIGVRKQFIEGAKLLHKISTEKLWEGQHGSFGEYVEQECQLSQSYASKLVQLYQYYAIEGGVSHAKLAAVDPEKAYSAMKLKGNPERQLAPALTLSRQELRTEVADKGEEHAHEYIEICVKCHKRRA